MGFFVSAKIGKIVASSPLLCFVVEVIQYLSLASIPNRYAFLAQIEQMIQKDPSFSLLLVDVVRFSDVSTGFGYQAGDHILCQIAERIQLLFPDAMLGRISGDIFGLVLSGSHSRMTLREHYNFLVEHFKTPIPVNNHAFIADFNVGAIANKHANKDVHKLFSRAEAALKQAKQNKYENFFCSELQQETLSGRALALKADLQRAIDNDELELYFQPIVDLNTFAIKGAECLLRWNHPTDGIMFPGALIEAAESYNMMSEVGYWVLDKALASVNTFRKYGLDIELSVNISPTQLYDMKFASRLDLLRQMHAADLSSLQLELTEDVALSDSIMVKQQLDSVRDLGIKIAVDDFGKGYSNLTFIRDLTFDSLKIDKTFVMGLQNNAVNFAVIKASKLIADALECRVIAEGIESVAHLHYLRDAGIDYGQGFLFSKAIPLNDFVRLAQSELAVGDSLAFRNRVG